jgi:hypothetical protein
MAVTELSNSVSAIAKRKAGTKVPKTEVKAINFHLSFGILDKLLKPISSKKKAANTIRSDPTCKAVKPTNPFLIKIKELPQIKESTIR